MMDEEAWQKLLRDFPHCTKTLSAWIDWLQENNDPRWEPYLILVDRYKNGYPVKGLWYRLVIGRLKGAIYPLTTPYIRSLFADVWLRTREDLRTALLEEFL